MSASEPRTRVVLAVVGVLLLGGAVALGLPGSRAWLRAQWAGAVGDRAANLTDHADHDHDADEDEQHHDEDEATAHKHGHAQARPGEPPHDHPHDEAAALALSTQAKANIGVRMTRVELRSFQRTISIPGMVVERPGWSTLEVTAPMTGVVTQIHPLQGEAVKPGQPLFEIRLTHEDLLQKQTDFLRTVEELDVIDREVERLEKVAASGAIPGKSLLDRKYEQQKQLASLRAQRQALLLHGLSDVQVDRIRQERTLLQSLTIVTPSPSGAAGTPAETRFQIQELKVSQGSSVISGSALCRLVDQRRLYVEGQAFEDDVRAVNQAAAQRRKVTAAFGTPGTEDALTIPDLEILYLDDRVDAQSRTFRFYVVLPNAIEREDATAEGHHFIYWRFKPGQRAQLKVPVQTWPDRIVLPVAAVAQDGLDFYVFEANNGHFDRRTVHVEYRDQDWVVIANDGALQPGVQVAESAAHQMQLALKNRAGAAPDPHAGHNH